MAQKSKPKAAAKAELDSVYVLKLVLYAIIGLQWVHLQSSSGASELPLPVGFLLGLGFASHEHFRIDRKIEFAVLITALFVGFFAQVGEFINM